MNEAGPQNSGDANNTMLSRGIALGTMVGLILGAIFDQFGVWLPLGMAVGTALGFALDWNRRSSETPR